MEKLHFYDLLKQFRNSGESFANLVGVKITNINEGFAEGELKITDSLKNHIHSVHGGAIFTIADIVGSTAVWSYGTFTTTLSCNIHYLHAAVDDGKLLALARVIKKGKRISVSEVEIYNERKVLLAKANIEVAEIGKDIKL